MESLVSNIFFISASNHCAWRHECTEYLGAGAPYPKRFPRSKCRHKVDIQQQKQHQQKYRYRKIFWNYIWLFVFKNRHWNAIDNNIQTVKPTYVSQSVSRSSTVKISMGLGDHKQNRLFRPTISSSLNWCGQSAAPADTTESCCTEIFSKLTHTQTHPSKNNNNNSTNKTSGIATASPHKR